MGQRSNVAVDEVEFDLQGVAQSTQKPVKIEKGCTPDTQQLDTEKD